MSDRKEVYAQGNHND